jgi:hypothetical protein
MLLALLAQLGAASASGQAAMPAPSPPADWSILPELSILRNWSSDPRLSDFVRDEVAAGRCAAGAAGRIDVDLALLVAGDGQVRRIVPRAIGCATVEQYASGLASQMIRRNVAVPEAEGWFRTTIRFAWAG